jgi:hypothetical protein
LWPVEGFQVSEEPIGEALDPEAEEAREAFASKTIDLPEPTVERERDRIEADKEEGITKVDALPEVITADMLRARKGKGIDLSQDFVIPAELLVGLEEEIEEEWEEEELDKRGRGGKGKAPVKATGKGKAKKPAKPEAKSKGKKWRPERGDDDF